MDILKHNKLVINPKWGIDIEITYTTASLAEEATAYAEKILRMVQKEKENKALSPGDLNWWYQKNFSFEDYRYRVSSIVDNIVYASKHFIIPSLLAEKLGVFSDKASTQAKGRAMNTLLEKAGVQQWSPITKKWHCTDLARPYCQVRPNQDYSWFVPFVATIVDEGIDRRAYHIISRNGY